MVRRIGLVLVSALALLVGLLAAAFGLAQTGPGKSLIASRLGAVLSTPEATVGVTGLTGLVPFEVRLAGLTVADPEGVWFEAEDLNLAWSPRALLDGRLQIDRLAAARVALDRLPPDEPTDEPIRLPELPDWLPPTTVHQLEVAEIDLAEDVLGAPARFALTGSLDMPDARDSADLTLDLQRTDQATASATLTATLQFEPPTLELSLQAHEDGGLLAAWTGEVGAGDLSLDLTGQGPLTSWKGELHVDAAGLARADATLGVALDDQLGLDVEGTVIPAQGVLPPDIAAVLGERLDLALAMVLTGPQQVRIEHLHATAADAELTAQGTVDFEAEKFQADVEAALSDLAAFSDLADTTLAGSARLDLVASGSLLQPKGTLQLAGDDLAAAGVSADSLTSDLTFAASAPLTSGLDGLSVTGSGQAQGLAAPDLDPFPLDDLGWQLDLRARQDESIDVQVLRLTMADMVVAFQGEVDPEPLAAAGRVDLTVDSLARLAAPYGQTVDGGLTLRADLVAAQDGAIEARLQGSLDRLDGLPEGAAELLGTTVALAGNVSLRESLVEIEDLAVSGEAASLGGDLAIGLPEETLNGTLSLQLPQLSALEPLLDLSVAGALTIDATVAGSTAEPDLDLTARGRALQLDGLPIEQLTLAATVQGLDAPAGAFDLEATTEGIDASLSSTYQLQDQVLTLSELVLTAPRSRVDGTLTIDLDQTLLDGNLRGRVLDLAGLAPLLPVPLRGEIDVDATLRPESGSQSVQLSLAARDLIGAFGRLRQLDAQAAVTDVLGEPRVEADATARDFHQDDLHAAVVTLNAAGTRQQLNLRGTVEGTFTEPFDLEARAGLALDETISVRIEQLSGQLAGWPLRQNGTADITLGETMRLSGLDLEVVGARITADASRAAGQITLDAALQDLSLAALDELALPDLLGNANAQLRMQGATSNPQATLDITITGLRAADPAFDDLPPAQLTASAALASGRLRVNARGEGVTDKPLVLSAELPMALRLEPFAFELPDGPVAGQLDAELQLARLADIAGLDDDRLEGLLDLALRLSGNVADPQLAGTVQVRDGIYENGFTGTVLDDLTLDATASRQRLTINELSANDGGSGSVRGQGFVEIDPLAWFPVDIALSLNRARLVQTEEASATISGDLTLKGPVTAADLAGTLTVNRAEVYLPDQVGPSVPTIEVEEVGGAGDGSGRTSGGRTPFDLGLDVVIDLPTQAFVRGRGLESEWQGQITARGTASTPRLNGAVTMRRGYFDLLSQRFSLTRGVIAFNGESPPDPTIDLEARAEAGDVTGIISVEGPATSPTLTLESEPPLPQDEVLSRIMFNRAPNEISAMQAVQLAAGLERLRGGGPGVLDRLRGALGIDTFDIAGDEDSGTTVRAGKYLSDRVYVEGESGTEDQSSRARVEVEILPNLSVEADTGVDARAGVGLNWRFDY